MGQPSERDGRAYWAAVVSDEQFAMERLYARDVIAFDPGEGGPATIGDLVVLIAAGDPPLLFGIGPVTGASESGDVLVEYRARMLDDPPLAAADAMSDAIQPGLSPLPAAAYARLTRVVSDA
ncbi:MAG: hypothetical protein L0Y54_16635, partial [Sporichthyaceae bacterium]|nr:hypothetical protein [Sporichthyaceae bacterium]